MSNTNTQITTDNSASKLVEYVNGISGSTSPNVQKSVSDIYVDDAVELYVGDFIQGGVSSTGTLTEDATSLVTKSLLVLPRRNMTLTVHIASGYKIALVYGVSSTKTGSFVTNGETITVPQGYTYYKVLIKKTDDSAVITENEIGEIGLYITYKSSKAIWPISVSSKEQIELVKLASDNGRLPLLAHISDVHSDNIRTKRMLDFCDDVGVLCACITGDNTNDKPANGGVYWLGDLCSIAKSNVMVCGGNHDSELSTFTQVFKLAQNKLGKRESTEFYRDFPDARLRMISFYQPTWNWGTRGKIVEDFVCDALLGTPAGFGSIIMYHCPETWIKGELPEGRDLTFYDGGENGSDWYSGHNQMIQNIVDAFIGGTIYNKVNTSGATVNFASKNSNAVFVAHMTGHIHNDNILNLQDAKWYDDNPSKTRPSHRQIMLNITSGNLLMGGDAPYYGGGKSATAYTQDAFNIYAIDLENEVINVVRIGWDKGGTRKSMTISFAQP